MNAAGVAHDLIFGIQDAMRKTSAVRRLAL
jgi:hypothetical protein